jgi:hypothetical protein
VFVTALRDLVTDRSFDDPLLKWNIYESQFNKKMKQWCNLAGVPQHDVHSLQAFVCHQPACEQGYRWLW